MCQFKCCIIVEFIPHLFQGRSSLANFWEELRWVEEKGVDQKRRCIIELQRGRKAKAVEAVAAVAVEVVAAVVTHFNFSLDNTTVHSSKTNQKGKNKQRPQNSDQSPQRVTRRDAAAVEGKLHRKTLAHFNFCHDNLSKLLIFKSGHLW